MPIHVRSADGISVSIPLREMRASEMTGPGPSMERLRPNFLLGRVTKPENVAYNALKHRLGSFFNSAALHGEFFINELPCGSHETLLVYMLNPDDRHLFSKGPGCHFTHDESSAWHNIIALNLRLLHQRPAPL